MSSILFYGSLKTQKLDRIGSPGPLSKLSTFLSQNIKKIKGGPFGEKEIFGKKSHNAEKKKEDPLVSPRIVCYAGKKENLFG